MWVQYIVEAGSGSTVVSLLPVALVQLLTVFQLFSRHSFHFFVVFLSSFLTLIHTVRLHRFSHSLSSRNQRLEDQIIAAQLGSITDIIFKHLCYTLALSISSPMSVSLHLFLLI